MHELDQSYQMLKQKRNVQQKPMLSGKRMCMHFRNKTYCFKVICVDVSFQMCSGTIWKSKLSSLSVEYAEWWNVLDFNIWKKIKYENRVYDEWYKLIMKYDETISRVYTLLCFSTTTLGKLIYYINIDLPRFLYKKRTNINYFKNEKKNN